MAKLLGTTNDKDTCDCCGRTDLKLTYVIEFGDSALADVRYYGSECASRALRVRAKSLKGMVDAANKKQAQQAVADEIVQIWAVLVNNRAMLETMPNPVPAMNYAGCSTAWAAAEANVTLKSHYLYMTRTDSGRLIQAELVKGRFRSQPAFWLQHREDKSVFQVRMVKTGKDEYTVEHI